MGAEAVGGMALAAAVTAVAVLGPKPLRRLGRQVTRVVGRLRAAHDSAPAPTGRPIELIARDARRLGPRFRHLQDGVSFARFEGGRRAYDEVLVEACLALGVEHLLRVIPPGPELDRERERVEAVLERAGLQLGDAA